MTLSDARPGALLASSSPVGETVVVRLGELSLSQVMQIMKLVSLSIAPLVLLCSCQMTGVDQTAAATATMKEIQTQLSKAPDSIGTVVETMEKLGTGTGNMQKQFTAYSKAVNAMHSHAALVRTLRRDFQKQRTAFTKDWGTRLEHIKDADLRKQAADRRDKALAAFKKLSDEADVVKAKFDPWMDNVKDVQQYLENDLHPSGVRSVTEQIKNAEAIATEIKAEFATLNKNLTEVVDNMSATKPGN